jgi:hypothetical protein
MRASISTSPSTGLRGHSCAFHVIPHSRAQACMDRPHQGPQHTHQPPQHTTMPHPAGTVQYMQYALLVRPAQVACPLSHVLVCRGFGAATPATYRTAGHGCHLLLVWGMLGLRLYS